MGARRAPAAVAQSSELVKVVLEADALGIRGGLRLRGERSSSLTPAVKAVARGAALILSDLRITQMNTLWSTRKSARAVGRGLDSKRTFNSPTADEIN